MAHYSPEPNRLRQKRSLQQFSFLDSEYAVMKAAFFALIVAVLSFQGSEAFLLGGPSVLDDLLKLVNGLLVVLRMQFSALSTPRILARTAQWLTLCLVFTRYLLEVLIYQQQCLREYKNTIQFREYNNTIPPL